MLLAVYLIGGWGARVAGGELWVGEPAHSGADLVESGAAVEGDGAGAVSGCAEFDALAAGGGGVVEGEAEEGHSDAGAAVGGVDVHFLKDGVASSGAEGLNVGCGADGDGLVILFGEGDEAVIAAGG